MKRAPVKILVVDDDRRTRTLLQSYLQELGFIVTTAPDGEQLEPILAKQKIDLLVLDLMLPGEDGLSLCRRLRGTGVELPIIMLTAKGGDVDRIVGLEMGADDYLAKPFNPRELVARIKAILRRDRKPPIGAPAQSDVVIRFGIFELNLGTRTLAKSGTPLLLTTGEFAVLEALVSHPRKPLSREKLMEFARGREHGAYDRSMDVQISRLRRLIESDSAEPRFIQTVWGFGYVFVPDASTT
ncbi:MAG TPA: two-component system response regulator OmpR [Steroidobacteraceae bacterium]|jgi:two-component system phosphate regulon response regulator OmpR|nr:two-component system response regulator OmpR [Steroidobacteraceae bacterium]